MIRRELISALLLVAACSSRRRPVAVRGDAGPAVVVVERRSGAPAPMPLFSETEPNDDRDHASELTGERTIRGFLQPPRVVDGKHIADEDWFRYREPARFDPDGGTLLRAGRIEVTGADGLDLGIDLYDERGRRLLAVNDGPPGAGETIPDLGLEPNRTYFLRIYEIGAGRPPLSQDGRSAQGGPYTLTWIPREPRQVSLLEPNDNAAHAVSVPLGVNLEGFYGKKHDEDWLKVALGQLAAGTTLRIELGPTDQVAPSLRVLIGNVTLAEARGSRASELRLRNVGFPPGADAVYVVVRAAEGTNVVQPYSLRLSSEQRLDGAEREPNGTRASATPLPIEGAISGFLWPTDVDWYCLPVGSGSRRVEVEGIDGIVLKLAAFDQGDKLLSQMELKAPELTHGIMLPDGGCLRVGGRPHDSTFDVPYHLTVGRAPSGG